MFILKEKIIEKMKVKNLSISKLEREAGLTIHSLRNVLKGRIKKPRFEFLVAIAKALECSPLDFIPSSYLSKTFERKNDTSTQRRAALDYPDLMIGCTSTIISLLEEKQCLSINQYLEIVKTLYLYSLPSEPKIPDVKFAKWLLEEEYIFSGKL